jgi:hypothetical protein
MLDQESEIKDRKKSGSGINFPDQEGKERQLFMV